MKKILITAILALLSATALLAQRYGPEEFHFLPPPVPKFMVFAGDNDRFMDIEKVKSMMEEFPAVRHILIENTGHNSFIEAEDTVYEQMCGFIG